MLNGNNSTPLFQSLSGTSAQRLAEQGRARPDGKSLSRTVQLLCGTKTDFLLVADSGPGDTTDKGLIVPRFENKPENHVAVSMAFDTLSGLLLMTKTHYEAWLSVWYMRRPEEQPKGSYQPKQAPGSQTTTQSGNEPFNFVSGEMF